MKRKFFSLGVIQIVFLLFSSQALFSNEKIHKAKPKQILPTTKTLNRGRIELALGKIRRIIDLQKDISGCLILYDGRNPEEPVRDVTRFEVVDKIKKGIAEVKFETTYPNEENPYQLFKVSYNHKRTENGLLVERIY